MQSNGSAHKRRRPEPSVTNRALNLLTRREHSRKELTRKLTSRGLDAAEVETVVDKLANAGWQNDTRFAENLVRCRAAGGYGPIHLRAELATHGLSREAIAAALDTFDGDWTENARDLVRRRYGMVASQDLAIRRKAAELLIRRGFDSASIRAATRFDPEDE